MTCISNNISLLMKTASTSGNDTSSEEKYTVVGIKHGNSTD